MLRKEDVLHVAELARLSLTDEEVNRYTEQLNQILSSFHDLQPIPTEDVPPTTHVAPLDLALHDDATGGCLSPEEIRKAAPRMMEDLVIVPKVLDGD